jgi:hypothetical protein
MADVNTRETTALIGSDKVEGTAVYGGDRNKIGSVQRVMIDKLSGKVAYAVISFGGFLGVGEDYYPVPWSTLKYDTNLGGYVTGVTEASLKSAPSTAANLIGIEVVRTIGVCTNTTKPNRSGVSQGTLAGALFWSELTCAEPSSGRRVLNWTIEQGYVVQFN